jgi:hypothetical protein
MKAGVGGTTFSAYQKNLTTATLTHLGKGSSLGLCPPRADRPVLTVTSLYVTTRTRSRPARCRG